MNQLKSQWSATLNVNGASLTVATIEALNESSTLYFGYDGYDQELFTDMPPLAALRIIERFLSPNQTHEPEPRGFELPKDVCPIYWMHVYGQWLIVGLGIHESRVAAPRLALIERAGRRLEVTRMLGFQDVISRLATLLKTKPATQQLALAVAAS